MNRDPYKTVTGFALLVPASPSEAMGEATFASEVLGQVHVRAIRLEEIRATAKKLRGVEAARFDALLSLRDALESRDQLALDHAMERMQTFYRLKQEEMQKTSDPNDPDDVGLGAIFSWRVGRFGFAQALGLPLEETAKYMAGVRSGPKALENPTRLFSYVVSEAVGTFLEIDVVLWWINGVFQPAIYCQDSKTALYLHTFFIAPVGGLGFRICPYDGEQFFQDRPNQEYCCPAHREAHRVARFRDNKKRKAAESGKKVRKSDGTQKTR